MFQPDQYQLLDFGAGRKLERFGNYLLDRPAPVTIGTDRGSDALWQRSSVCYQRQSPQSGEWVSDESLPACWTIEHRNCKFELRWTPFGHVGVFPEQAENWDWIDAQIRGTTRPLKVLNLFAYTGGSTMAAAAANAQVVHVDSARNVVRWARRNLELSRLSSARVRWITEDAPRFVQREVRRGNRYDAVILDPPTYGHGSRGEPWKIEKHLVPLLRACRDLTAERLVFLLLSCHSPGYDPRHLSKMLRREILGDGAERLMVTALELEDVAGRKLPGGVVARWPEKP